MSRNFNTNQNRHVYVVKEYQNSADAVQTTGDITLKSNVDKDGKIVDGGTKKVIYFVYKGADTVMKSSLIQVENISYVKAIKAADLRTPFKSQIVSLSDEVNSGKPVSGQDYILRIVLSQWIGMSDEDKYFKDVAVHATKAMAEAADNTAFYQKFVDQLNLAFAREIGATKDSNPYLSFKADKDGITITEKAQPWRRGLEQQLPVLFDAQCSTIYVDGEDVVWGTIKSNTVKKSEVTIDGDNPTGRGNGHDIADLEYFSMGERGDQYRMVGFPNIIPTEYLVEPDKEYNVLEIHHAFTDDGISSYKSEKDITIVSTDAAKIDKIIAALKTATGIEVDTIGATTGGAKQNTLTGSEEEGGEHS